MPSRTTQPLEPVKGGIVNKLDKRSVPITYASDGSGYVVEDTVVRTVGIGDAQEHTIDLSGVTVPTFGSYVRDKPIQQGNISILNRHLNDQDSQKINAEIGQLVDGFPTTGALTSRVMGNTTPQIHSFKEGSETYHIIVAPVFTDLGIVGHETLNRDLAVVFFKKESDETVWMSGVIDYLPEGGRISQEAGYRYDHFKFKRLDFGLGLKYLIYPDPNADIENPKRVVFNWADISTLPENGVSRLVGSSVVSGLESHQQDQGFDIFIEEDDFIGYSYNSTLSLGGSISAFKGAYGGVISDNSSRPIVGGASASRTFLTKVNSSVPVPTRTLTGTDGTTKQATGWRFSNTESENQPIELRYKNADRGLIHKPYIVGLNVRIYHKSDLDERSDSTFVSPENPTTQDGERIEAALFTGTIFDNLNQRTYTENIVDSSPLVVGLNLGSGDKSLYLHPNIKYNQSGNSISIDITALRTGSTLGQRPDLDLDNWFAFVEGITVAYGSEEYGTQRVLTPITTESDHNRNILATASFRDTAFIQANDGIRSYDVAVGSGRDIITTELIFPSIEIPSADAIHSSESGLSFVDVFNEQNPRVLSVIRPETNEDFGLREFGSLFRFQDYDMERATISTFGRYVYVVAKEKKTQNYHVLLMDSNEEKSVFIVDLGSREPKLTKIDNALTSIQSERDGDNVKSVIRNVLSYVAPTTNSTVTSGYSSLGVGNRKVVEGITVLGRISRNAEVDVQVLSPIGQRQFISAGKVTVADVDPDVLTDVSNTGDGVSDSVSQMGDQTSDTNLYEFEKTITFTGAVRELAQRRRYFAYRFVVSGGHAELHSPILEGVMVSDQP